MSFSGFLHIQPLAFRIELLSSMYTIPLGNLVMLTASSYFITQKYL